jgi:hypothetical protein
VSTRTCGHEYIREDCSVCRDAYAEFKQGELQAVRDLMCNHDIEMAEAEATAAALQAARERVGKVPESWHLHDLELLGHVDRAAVLAALEDR